MSADVHALAGAYALDALPSDERAFFERHLAACDACRAEVAELTETAARLGSAAAAPPPPALRDRILAQVDVTRQLPPERESVPAVSPGRAQPRWLVPVAACLALAVLVLSGAVVALGQRSSTPAEVAGNEQMVAVLGAADLQTATLPMETATPGRFLYSPSQNQGVLVVAGMPEVASDQTYELWLFHDGEPVPAGVFRPGDGGAAVAAVEGIVQGAEQVAVTVEPAGGSPRPTGAVLASADLERS
jgi:anti-sigma-K factor RskA